MTSPIEGPAVEPVAPATARHLDRLRQFYEQAPTAHTAAGKRYRRLLGQYYRHIIPSDASVLEVGCGSGELLAQLPNKDIVGVDLANAQVEAARARLPHGQFFVQAGETLSLDRTFDYVIVSETLNFAGDVQLLLSRLHSVSRPDTRLVVNFYNTLWRPVLSAATASGLKARQPAINWLNNSDTRSLLELAGWRLVTEQPRILLPVAFFGLDVAANRFLAPLLPWFCLTVFHVARPAPSPAGRREYSVSVVIPARNEAGNIALAVARMPRMGSGVETIFVEGHSKDNTWETIQRVVSDHPDAPIQALQQRGDGKGDAVREGFAAAHGDVLMILDADLTVPPEDLVKFYDVIASGSADFANGVRLVYPMEDRAMPFLNLLANKTFGFAFSWVLGQPVKDTLCGTKVMLRSTYEQIAANRRVFGDFDPFGDFDLLFGAARLNCKIVDIPLRYQERSYGTTNIRRWRHGVLLLKMLIVGLRRLKWV